MSSNKLGYTGWLSGQGLWPWLQLTGVLLLLMLCFPNFDPVYNRGMDGTMPWVFNYLFDGHLPLGRPIIFPHGPLAFFLYPVPFGHNLEWAILLWLLLATWFSFNIFALLKARAPWPCLLALLFSWYFLSAFNLQLLIIGVLLSSFLRAFDHQHYRPAAAAILLGSLALFIKSYVGIVSGLLVFSFVVSEWWLHRHHYRSLAFIGLYLSGIVVIWLSMYNDLNGLAGYIRGVAELASDNSSAAAYYPDNNWWYLSGFLALYLLLPVVLRQRKMFIFYALTALASFAAWKHGMARQDVAHTGQLFTFFCLMAGLMLLYFRRKVILLMLVQLAFLGLFYLNFSRVLGFEHFAIDFWRFDHFKETIADFDAYKEKHLNLSAADVADRKLSPELLRIIGDATVDVYPWDYAFIAANELNWQPRPVIQSYAAYSSYLDHLNADHFHAGKEPEFILWEVDKLSLSRYGENLGSIDSRYLLNDEPQAILEILNHYRIRRRSEKVVLLQRRQDTVLSGTTLGGSLQTGWNRWLKVPEVKDGFLRCRVSIRKNLAGRLKSFLYKGEESFVYYRLRSGSILSYKIVPKNAADGLWVNPLVLNIDDSSAGYRVEAIQFRNSNRRLMKNEIQLQWELNELSPLVTAVAEDTIGDPDFVRANAAFAKHAAPQVNHLATIEVPLRKQSQFDHQQNALELLPGEFSPGYELPVDSLLKGRAWPQIEVETSVWALAGRYGSSALVITVQRGEEVLSWEHQPLRYWMIDEEELDYVGLSSSLSRDFLLKCRGADLKVFVWNTDEKPILIRDFIVNFKGTE